MSSAVFIGTVQISLRALERVIALDFPLNAICTLPIEKGYRHSDYVDLAPIAESNGIQCFHTEFINSSEAVHEIQSYQPDFIFCIGWSQILSRNVLEIPKKGCVGFHPSPLPQNRGRAVIPWTILQGRSETAGSLFWLDEGVDSGEIIMQHPIELDYGETASTLYDKQVLGLENMLNEVLPLLKDGRLPRAVQNHGTATYCSKRTRSDGFINWELPALDIWNLIRATSKPYPGAFSLYEGSEIIIWEADLIKSPIHTGLPGQIQAMENGHAIVSCGGGTNLIVKKVQVLGKNEAIPSEVLKVQSRMGLSRYEVASKIIEQNNK
ncbi:MAG: methionyl-tRNA formyltransferase [Opitutae bacterium]|jgi:methionyl-tRNA formyltransferase|nr:methionyl-tRNA formyltransferase [Opitutae bacterium]